MPSSSQKLEWCIVRLGSDLSWWVEEISDPVHWDVDGLGIIDPRQMSYIIEQCDVLREYGFDPDVIERAFFPFTIDREEKEKEGHIRLVRSKESLIEDDTPLFALPDVVDEEKGPYADFLDDITRSRVRMLNDLIEFDQKLTVDELEEEIRERQNQEYMEGKAVHFFTEITSILDYVPEGYELEEDERPSSGDEDIEDLPDFEETESDDEKIEEDETMRWDEDDEKDEKDFDEEKPERPDDFDDPVDEEPRR